MNRTKSVVKYHKDKKSGIHHKRTLLLTIQGPNLYWSYDTKKQKLEIYEDKILD
jgi:Uma2 family endonuclease